MFNKSYGGPLPGGKDLVGMSSLERETYIKETWKTMLYHLEY